MLKRDYFKIRAVKKNDSVLFIQYRRQRNGIVKIMKSAKSSCYSNIILNNMSKAENLSSSVKKVLPCKSSLNVHTLKINGENITDPCQVARAFYAFFTTIGSKLAEKFTNLNWKNVTVEKQHVVILLSISSPQRMEERKSNNYLRRRIFPRKVRL